jgi:hypothetical protein
MVLANKLVGKPKIDRRKVGEAQLNEWVSMLKSSAGMTELIRGFLAGYRAR